MAAFVIRHILRAASCKQRVDRLDTRETIPLAPTRRLEDLMNSRIYCVFCGKHDEEVGHMVTGKFANICGACVFLSVDTILKELRAKAVRLELSTHQPLAPKKEP